MLEREGSARAEKSELGAAVRRSGILVQKCTPEEVMLRVGRVEWREAVRWSRGRRRCMRRKVEMTLT